ncbi:MAG TPA: hypothetical protein ENH94_06970 [Phycisphaerales bacterium]|nr:hypothetical protein [Phycisphaerales bacterium]
MKKSVLWIKNVKYVVNESIRNLVVSLIEDRHELKVKNERLKETLAKKHALSGIVEPKEERLEGGIMKIELEISEKNEGTNSPWWMIVNPWRSLGFNETAIQNIASMITGPFFSRAEAQQELDKRRSEYGKHAVVFCSSGYNASQYREAIRKAMIKKKNNRAVRPQE